MMNSHYLKKYTLQRVSIIERILCKIVNQLSVVFQKGINNKLSDRVMEKIRIITSFDYRTGRL